MMRQSVERLPGQPRWGTFVLVGVLVLLVLVGWHMARLTQERSTPSESPPNETPVPPAGSRALAQMPRDYVMRPPALATSTVVEDAPPLPPTRETGLASQPMPPLPPPPPLRTAPASTTPTVTPQDRAAARAALLRSRKSRTLGRPEASTTSEAKEGTLQPPPTPYQLNAGALIPLIAEDAMDSTVPGLASFVVRESVRDSIHGRYVLLPWGTRVLLRTGAAQAPGTQRYPVTALTLPFDNGYELPLTATQVGDAAGRAGLADQVDHRTLNVIGTMLLEMMRRAPMTVASGASGGTSAQLGQMAAQEAAETGGQHAASFLSTAPIFRIRGGYLATIRLERRLNFPAPYPFRTGLVGAPQPLFARPGRP